MIRRIISAYELLRSFSCNIQRAEIICSNISRYLFEGFVSHIRENPCQSVFKEMFIQILDSNDLGDIEMRPSYKTIIVSTLLGVNGRSQAQHDLLLEDCR